MKTLTMAVIVAIGVGGTAVAQQRSTRDMMNEFATRREGRPLRLPGARICDEGSSLRRHRFSCSPPID
jgi:hypothetical protein